VRFFFFLFVFCVGYMHLHASHAFMSRLNWARWNFTRTCSKAKQQRVQISATFTAFLSPLKTKAPSRSRTNAHGATSECSSAGRAHCPPPFSSALRLGRTVLPAIPERGRGERQAELLLIPEGLQPSHSAHSKGREQSELGHLLAEPLPSWSQSAGGALQTRTQVKYTHGNKSRTQRISLRIISSNRYIVRVFYS